MFASRLRDSARRGGPSSVRPGRPRDPLLDSAIQAAALAVLAEGGYAGLTMEAVAETAGVSKGTIYRRWASKDDLLLSLIDVASDRVLVVPDTGSLEEDLIRLLGGLARILNGPGGRASRALVGALTDQPALAAAWRDGPRTRWADAFATVFERAVGRGEVTAAAGTSLAAEAGPAIFMLRWVIMEAHIDDALAAAVVRDVMMPLLRKL